jgi:hypothetical protein
MLTEATKKTGLDVYDAPEYLATAFGASQTEKGEMLRPEVPFPIPNPEWRTMSMFLVRVNVRQSGKGLRGTTRTRKKARKRTRRPRRRMRTKVGEACCLTVPRTQAQRGHATVVRTEKEAA